MTFRTRFRLGFFPGCEDHPYTTLDRGSIVLFIEDGHPTEKQCAGIYLLPAHGLFFSNGLSEMLNEEWLEEL
jgi:hypothetical protein